MCVYGRKMEMRGEERGSQYELLLRVKLLQEENLCKKSIHVVGKAI